GKLLLNPIRHVTRRYTCCSVALMILIQGLMGKGMTNTTAMLMKNVQSGKLKPAELITHRFAFNDFMRAYEVFGNASKEKALKVIIDNS
ncbi:hypothetical protein, partial [Oceanisphaera marina]